MVGPTLGRPLIQGHWQTQPHYPKREKPRSEKTKRSDSGAQASEAPKEPAQRPEKGGPTPKLLAV